MDTFCRRASLNVFFILTLSNLLILNTASADLNLRSVGFTGKDVPALSIIRGDYINVGVRTSDGRTDIPKLITALKNVNATDYMNLVWTENRYPNAWSDFPIMAAAFQKVGINLWLHLPPPSEGVPAPYGNDYVRWATECAKVASKYPIIKGISIDDFDQNTNFFTPAYCKKMMDAAHKIAPKLSLLIVSYYGKEKQIAKYVTLGAIDGIIMPYFYPQKNLTDTSLLMNQISNYRTALDRMSTIGKHKGKMPLFIMVYALKNSESTDVPTPSYVGKCLDIAFVATKYGLANGAIVYGLPKNNDSFMQAVAASFNKSRQSTK